MVQSYGPRHQPQPPKLLEQVRETIRARHYSLRTEETYLRWIKRFILFHGKQHPREMGVQEVQQFLAHLAVAGRVAAFHTEPGVERHLVSVSAGSQAGYWSD